MPFRACAMGYCPQKAEYSVPTFPNYDVTGNCAPEGVRYDTYAEAWNWLHSNGYLAAGNERYDAHVVDDDGNRVEPSWRDREAIRFHAGKYLPAPWHNEPWYQAKHNDHFCHMSVKDGALVAYTENEQKGEADRQTRTRPGRYLTKFFSDVLTNEQIEQWCAKLSVAFADCSLRVTQDADEIEEIYRHGPRSCMTFTEGDYSGPEHPARVYAGPDLGLAYLGPIGGAKARCVVWPGAKVHGRVYGDISRMRLLLEEAGYVEGTFEGARLRRIDAGHGVVLPYLDNGETAYDRGHDLVIGGGHGGSPLPSQNTCGIDRVGAYCEGCDEYQDPDGFDYVEDLQEHRCEHCCDNRTWVSDRSGMRYSDDVSPITVYLRQAHRRYPSEVTVHEDELDDVGASYIDERGEYWAGDSVVWFCNDEPRHYDDVRADYDGQDACKAPIAHIELRNAIKFVAPPLPTYALNGVQA